MAHVHQMVDSRQPNARCCDPRISERLGVRESLFDGYMLSSTEHAATGLREINSTHTRMPGSQQGALQDPTE